MCISHFYKMPGRCWQKGPCMNTCFPQDFDIRGTTLVSYNGKANHVIVPAGVTVIDSWAFCKKRSLKCVELPNTVTTIKSFAFNGCRALERIVIPQSALKLDIAMIWECDQVTIYAPTGSAAAKYAAEKSTLFVPMDSNTSTPNFEDFIIQGTTLVKYYGNDVHVTVPTGVTVIGSYAFYRRSKLKTVELPDTVTTIKNSAFAECRALERIAIPQSGTELVAPIAVDCGNVTFCDLTGSAAKHTSNMRPVKEQPYQHLMDWDLQSHPLLSCRQGGEVRQLRGNILITVYLVTDKRSSWTAAAEADYRRAHDEAVQDMEQEALRRQIPLRIHTVYKKIQVSYTCTVSDWSWSDKLEPICPPDSAPGYDERPVIMALNKKLRSFAYPKEKANGISMSKSREYCVIGLDDYCFIGNTIRHELFHIFGAPDLYTPRKVQTLAIRLFPASIMNGGRFTDALTAYCIGWTDTLSPEAMEFLRETRNIKL